MRAADETLQRAAVKVAPNTKWTCATCLAPASDFTSERNNLPVDTAGERAKRDESGAPMQGRRWLSAGFRFVSISSSARRPQGVGDSRAFRSRRCGAARLDTVFAYFYLSPVTVSFDLDCK